MPQHVVFTANVAAQQCAHARRQLVQAERLRQVIVGARIEPSDPIGDGVARRDDQHADAIARPAQLAQQLEAAFARQTEIEQHHRIRVLRGGDRGPARLAVRHAVDRVAVLRERLLQRLADHRVVFDEQDAHASLRIGCCRFYVGNLKRI